MSILEAVIMGLVQGLTEFLPISSSGHLVIAKQLLGSAKRPGILFEVMLHFGTLLAVLVYFRVKISSILCSLLPSSNMEEAKRRSERGFAMAVIIGTLPTVVIALLFKDVFEELFDSVKTVSFMLLITGILLYLSDKVKKGGRETVRLRDALIIGTVQGMAIIPGISRSGSTIATGLFGGLKAETAATYSFLLSIPAILGAVVLHAGDLTGFDNGNILPYTAGVLAAAISGFLSIKILMKIVAGRNLRFFAFYCWTLGIGSLIIGI
jgi:undecaprenyl-diphosphatase